MRDNENGKYENDDISVELELSGEEILCAKQKNNYLIKLPVKEIKALIEKQLNKELSGEELALEIKKYSGSILVSSTFSVGFTAPYEYGADADGNRGITVEDYTDVESDDLDISRIELYIFDEDGNELGGSNHFIDLSDYLLPKDDSLVDYILSEINDNISDYV